jgi:hypothetical protein
MTDSRGERRFTCFDFCEKVLADVDDFAERHSGLLALILYSGLCSGVEGEGSRTSLPHEAHLGKENSAIRRLASNKSRVPGVQNSSCCE